MAVWMIRGGSSGEHEQKFLEEKRVYVTWSGLDVDLGSMNSTVELQEALAVRFPEAPSKRISNWTGQIWPFAHQMGKGDIVAMPLKGKAAIAFGEITGGYKFEREGPSPYYHWRPVKWLVEAVPRSRLGQDLLYSLGSIMTICRVRRNDAESRITALRANGWKTDPGLSAQGAPQATATEAPSSNEGQGVNLAELAADQIAKTIGERFRMHDLARLVEGVLKAQGYATYRSPAGPDGGADILAGTGPLGFGTPRLCVEVKSGEDPVDRPTVDKLIGAIAKFGATEGLFVSWSGYRKNVRKELASSYFRVRLWDRDELLEALFANYDKLDEDLRTEIPLKRVWMLAALEED